MDIREVWRLIASCKTDISNLGSRLQAAKDSLAAAVADPNEYAQRRSQIAELEARLQGEKERLESLNKRHVEIDASLKPAALSQFIERISPLNGLLSRAALKGQILKRAGEKMGAEYEKAGTHIHLHCQGFDGQISRLRDLAEKTSSGTRIQNAIAAIPSIEQALDNDRTESLADGFLEAAWDYHTAYAARELGRGSTEAVGAASSKKDQEWQKFQEAVQRLRSSTAAVSDCFR